MLKFLNTVFIFWCGYSSLFGQQKSTHTDSIVCLLPLNEVVITAQYKPIHYTKVLHKTDILKGETLARMGITHLDQALKNLPSVRLSQDFVLGTSVKLNGISGNNVAILIDGVPVIGRQGGSVDVSQIPLLNVARIEVIKGPLSNYYGNNAAGGVINIITKNSGIDKVNYTATGQYSSIGDKTIDGSVQFNYKQLSIGVNAGWFDYSLHAADSLRVLIPQQTADGSLLYTKKYPWNPKNQIYYGSSITYRPNNDHKIRLKYHHLTEDVKSHGHVRRPRYKPYSNDIFFETSRNDFSLKYDGSFQNKTYIDATLAYNHYDREITHERFFFESSDYDEKFARQDSNVYTQLYNRIQINHEFTPKIKGALGYNLASERAQGGKIIDPENESSEAVTAVENAFYASTTWEPSDKWKLGLSSRFIFHSQYEPAVIPAFYAKYSLSDRAIFRFSIAGGYRSPSLKETYLQFIDVNHHIIGNTNLEPERSISYQLGADWKWKNEVQLSCNAFHTAINDRIVLAEFAPVKYNYQNVAKFASYGSEAKVTIPYKNWLWSNGFNTVWTNSSVDDSKSLFTADIQSNLQYTLEKYGLSSQVNYRFVGRQPTFVYNNNELEVAYFSPQQFLDWSVQKQWDKKFKAQLTLGINNILNIRKSNLSNTTATAGGAHNAGTSRTISRGREYFIRVKNWL